MATTAWPPSCSKPPSRWRAPATISVNSRWRKSVWAMPWSGRDRHPRGKTSRTPSRSRGSLGDERTLFAALGGLALACIRLGDLGVARQAVLEAIALGEASGERYGNAMNLLTLGLIEAREGDPDSAGQRLAEGIRQLHTAGGHSGLSVALDVLATLAIERGRAGTRRTSRRGGGSASSGSRRRPEYRDHPARGASRPRPPDDGPGRLRAGAGCRPGADH